MEVLIIKSINNNRVSSLLLDMLIFTLVATRTAWHYFSISFMLLMAEHAIKNDSHRNFSVDQTFSAQEGPCRVEKGKLALPITHSCCGYYVNLFIQSIRHEIKYTDLMLG